tara:strand:- start:13526 stop:13750 length:225 start_codon:yes stop_codon:yes gene_type:complete
MPRPRLNQFAEDLGISRGSAEKLMAKARGRRDGGSTVLENTMNKTKDIVEAKDGKYVRGMGKASVCPPRKVQVR